MSTVKRVRLAVLFLIAAALLAGTASLAAPQRTKASGTALLKPPATSDEPKASGRAAFTGLWARDPQMGWYVFGDLTVTCGGLTPGATYRTSAGSFRASTTGNGTATVTGIYPPSNISVAREETQADGSVGLSVVLEGTLKVR